jgi:ABC-type branched-subunit amino acid transport system ATPase component
VSELSVRRDGERVLDSISLRVEPGSIVGIVGPNGAGKTTLLDAISGIVLSESGMITVGDLEIVSLPARARASLGLARTFEKLGLVGELSLEENLLLAQQHSLPYGVIPALARSPSVGRAETQARERAAAAAATCGVAGMLAVRTHELSFGQQRLGELACAIASGAGVLLLDEPSAGLGSEARVALRGLLSQLRGRHTILLVEHDLELAAAVSGHLCVLEEGRMVAFGPPTEIALPASLTPPRHIR